MRENRKDIIFSSPEKLQNEKVRENLKNIRIGLLVIDEAHCISDWGHDFRLEYNKIYKVVNTLHSGVPILATTATANDSVIEDLTNQMGVPNLCRGHLMRENLFIQVLNLSDKYSRYAWILDNINNLPGTGIIYCLTKHDCKWLTEFLNINGIKAKSYYSGDYEQEEKNDIALKEFINDEIKAIVSTIKLGMGFDKGNVGFVIHFQCPKNIIAYYQQIGRAGRNLKEAKTFLMTGEENLKIQENFIKDAFPQKSEMEDVRKNINKKGYATINTLMQDIDYSKKCIIKALDFLEYGNMIDKKWESYNGNPYKRYTPTANPFFYDGNHYEELRKNRYKELQQLYEFAETKECYNRKIVNFLDDNETRNCGICANCAPEKAFSLKISNESLTRAKEYLDNLAIEIPPIKYWPRSALVDNQANKAANIPGICLSKYGEGIYGNLVKNGKYLTGHFDDALVDRACRVLTPKIKEYNIGHVTCVPSLRSDVVPDFTKRLADKLGIEFIELLEKTDESKQKDMNNLSHQFDNAVRTFETKTDVEFPTSILLVDDIVDSGLTLAVCGAELWYKGCKTVLPFALASSGTENNGEEDNGNDE